MNKTHGLIGLGVALTATLCSTVYLFLENKKLREDIDYLEDKVIEFSEYIYDLETELNDTEENDGHVDLTEDNEEIEEKGEESSSEDTANEPEESVVENIFDNNPVYPVSNRFIPESEVNAAKARLQERMDKNKELYHQAVNRTKMDLIENSEEDFIEVEGMRYDPNSEEAWEAYKRMRLSDIYSELDPNFNDEYIEMQKEFIEKYGLENGVSNPDDLFEHLENLFEYDVPLKHSHDNNYRELIYDKRYEFFGPNSRFTNIISFGEVLLEIVDQILDNLEIPCRTIILEQIFINMEIYDSTPAQIGMTISEICSHTYFGELGYGLFGLNRPDLFSPVAEERKLNDEMVIFTNQLLEYDQG